MRKTPLRPSSRPIARGERIKAKPRTKAERERIYGSDERIVWVQSQPCVVPHCRMHHSENAHVGNGGMGRKADAAQIVPLCFMCHDELHHYGVKSFEEWYSIDLKALAAETDAKWQAECARRASEGRGC